MYWGFEQLGDEEIVQVTEEARAVLFLGGSDHLNATEMYDSVERLLFWFPNITEDQTQQVRSMPWLLAQKPVPLCELPYVEHTGL